MQDHHVGLVALRIAMRAAGVSQSDLARGLGCSRAWVHDVVHGEVKPSPKFIRLSPVILAEQLGEDPSELRAILFPEVSS